MNLYVNLFRWGYTPANISYLILEACDTLKDGSVVTWGQKWAGGSSISVQEELRDIYSIAAARYAFVALREDGCPGAQCRADGLGILLDIPCT